MDKYDLVLDIIENPGKYPPEKLEAILSDPETKEIYETVCLTSSAANSDAPVSPEEIESEWQRLAAEIPAGGTEMGQAEEAIESKPRFLYLFRSRAAAVAAVTLTSMVAVAIGVGMKYGFVEKGSAASVTGESPREVAVTSVVTGDTAVSSVADSLAVDMTPVVFEDETLGNILSRIASVHGVKVRIAPSKASLRLYFKWNPSEPLVGVVNRLNNFEQFEIAFDGKTIKVD